MCLQVKKIMAKQGQESHLLITSSSATWAEDNSGDTRKTCQNQSQTWKHQTGNPVRCHPWCKLGERFTGRLRAIFATSYESVIISK